MVVSLVTVFSGVFFEAELKAYTFFTTSAVAAFSWPPFLIISVLTSFNLPEWQRSDTSVVAVAAEADEISSGWRTKIRLSKTGAGGETVTLPLDIAAVVVSGFCGVTVFSSSYSGCAILRINQLI